MRKDLDSLRVAVDGVLMNLLSACVLGVWGATEQKTGIRVSTGQNSVQNSVFSLHAAIREAINHQNGVIGVRHVISCNILSRSNVRSGLPVKPVFCSVAPQTPYQKRFEALRSCGRSGLHDDVGARAFDDCL